MNVMIYAEILSRRMFVPQSRSSGQLGVESGAVQQGEGQQNVVQKEIDARPTYLP
jgi:hypothetical protein